MQTILLSSALLLLLVHQATPGWETFAKLLFDRIKVVFKEGKLCLDFDWSGIKRVQLEAAARAEKLAETKRKNEEER